MVYDVMPERWRSNVPIFAAQKKKEEKKEQTNSTIAWRYDSMDIKVKQENVAKVSLNLGRHVPPEEVTEEKLKTFELTSFTQAKALFQHISAELQNNLRDPKDTKARRIVLSNFEQFWKGTNGKKVEMTKLFVALRTLVRSSHSVVLLSCQMSGLPAGIAETMRSLADVTLRLELKGQNQTEFGEFDGFFKVVGLRSLNKVLSWKLDTLVFGFKSQKQEFLIEKLYLSVDEKEPPKFTDIAESHPEKPAAAAKVNVNYEF
eukprot:TRINITY_DN25062_c0_g1_i1.p1 TRINITY_DN25062_c0_g1~~TRINITY_DN25062_c0_g1_i1.p1  ORF type:complete len:260 (-),score=79.00 TRINITY_DN25062_c0_g1_i1:37-816(-)